MAKSLRHHLQGDSRFEPRSRVGVPHVPERNAGHAGRYDRSVEGVGDRLGVVRRPVLLAEDEADAPEPEERDASFVVRLRGRSLFAAEDRLWVGRFREMGLGGDALTALVYARRQGTIANEELRNLRHLDRDASRAVLQDLVNRGLVATVGRGRAAATP